MATGQGGGGGDGSSSLPLEHKQYTEEEQKLIHFMRPYHSQPLTFDSHPMNPIGERKMNAYASSSSEIIHIPPKYQRFRSSLDLPHAAAAIIRHSPSTIRTFVQSNTGQSYIELKEPTASNPSNSNNISNREDDTSLQSDSTSAGPTIAQKKFNN